MTEKGIILLLGGPGAGKGTQAQRLAREFNLEHLSTGDVLRETARNGTALGEQLRMTMERGELVADELVAEIIRDRMGRSGSHQAILLDGFPRNMAQADLLERFAPEKPLWVVNIQVDEEILMKRLSGRRYCGNCGRIYNFYFSPSREEGVCDVCGSMLVHRGDDDEQVVYRRLEVYRKATKPLIEWYSKRRDHYFQVDGNSDPETVYQEVVDKLERIEGLDLTKDLERRSL